MTAWGARMVPVDWPVVVTAGGLVLCGKGDCEEPLTGLGPVGTLQRTTLAGLLDAVKDHMVTDHGEAIP